MVDPEGDSDCDGIHRDVFVGKVAAEENFAGECVAKGVDRWRVDELEEFNGSTDDNCEERDGQGFCAGEEQGEAPVDERGPEE